MTVNRLGTSVKAELSHPDPDQLSIDNVVLSTGAGMG